MLNIAETYLTWVTLFLNFIYCIFATKFVTKSSFNSLYASFSICVLRETLLTDDVIFIMGRVDRLLTAIDAWGEAYLGICRLMQLAFPCTVAIHTHHPQTTVASIVLEPEEWMPAEAAQCWASTLLYAFCCHFHQHTGPSQVLVMMVVDTMQWVP